LKSALFPAPFRAGTAVPLSLGLHLAAFGFLATATQCKGSESAYLIDPSEVMEVAMIALPKSEKLHRVTRAPDPAPTPAQEIEAPAPDPTPPTESSDMQLKVEKEEKEDPPKEPPKEQPKPDNSKVRQALMDQMARDARRKEFMESLKNAPVGKENRPPADPNGIDNATGDSMGAMGDPIIAAWAQLVKTTVLSHFSPLQTEALSAIFQITINRAGKIVSSKMLQSSGDRSYDAAARNAIRNVGRLPSPPAEKMPNALASISIDFSNID
jgi:TonB family protein